MPYLINYQGKIYHLNKFKVESLLSRNTQMQKNVANRIRDLTGSEIIMLNDHLYMKNLCKRLDEKHQVDDLFFLIISIN
jgi:hypothetical protein